MNFNPTREFNNILHRAYPKMMLLGKDSLNNRIEMDITEFAKNDSFTLFEIPIKYALQAEGLKYQIDENRFFANPLTQTKYCLAGDILRLDVTIRL